MTIEYTTPGTTGVPLTYTWSPALGLYTNPGATTAYVAGSQTDRVYAAPDVNTVYTVTGTNGNTGCFNTGTITVLATPAAPTVTPNPVAMCLGDPAVLLTILPATPVTACLTATPNVLVPDNTANGVNSIITMAGIPAGAIISSASVTLNMSHTYPGDMIFNLRAPNGQILNLYKYADGAFTGPASGVPTWGWYGAQINSGGTVAFNTVAAAPFIYNSTTNWKADIRNTAVAGPVVQNPTGFVSAATAFSDLYSIPNGAWTLAMADGGAGDVGTLASWTLCITYTVGAPPPTNGVWTPAAGLYTNAGATTPYVAGTQASQVYARPTTIGANNYQVTVTGLGLDVFPVFSNPAAIAVPGVGTSGPAGPYPSTIAVTGLPVTGTSVQEVTLTGITHTWESDISVLLQNPAGTQNVILMSAINGSENGGFGILNKTYTFSDAAATGLTAAGPTNPSGTYKPSNNSTTRNWPAPGPGTVVQGANPLLSTFTGDPNGAWKLYVFDAVGGDAGNIAGGYSIKFRHPGPGCQSAPRTVVVTVNDPTKVNTEPVDQVICTDKVATFTVVAGGTGPFSYRWEVSTNGGNPPWGPVNNGGVYSGATTATLTITAPPVTMSGYRYRCIITGAAPCAAVTSLHRSLTVNPLPTVVIAANRTSLVPGLTATLTSSVIPSAGASYTWLRNGVPVAGAISSTLVVDVDGLGDYRLRVTDFNNCTNTSNVITIKDSATARCYIYPNPTSGKFQVRYHSVANNNLLPRTLTIFDAKGDRVFTKLYSIGQPYDRMEVDMRAYGKGLYWVEIGDMNGNRLTMCRVAIQ